MTTGSSDAWVDQLRELERGPLHRFLDWEINRVPNWKAGVYTIWESCWVGIGPASGRQSA